LLGYPVHNLDGQEISVGVGLTDLTEELGLPDPNPAYRAQASWPTL